MEELFNEGDTVQVTSIWRESKTGLMGKVVHAMNHPYTYEQIVEVSFTGEEETVTFLDFELKKLNN